MKMIKALLLIVFFSVSLSFAHRVNLFAQIESGKIVCQCYYSDGTPVRHQKIEVFNASGEKLLAGETDDQGGFTFTPPTKSNLKIVLDAGMGHRAETLINANDLPEFKPVEKRKPVAVKPEDIQTDEEQLRKIIEEVIDEKLHSVKEMIIRQQRSTSLTTVLGGIGYIFGIFGLIMYLRKKKQK
jgi:nickel transport protein